MLATAAAILITLAPINEAILNSPSCPDDPKYRLRLDYQWVDKSSIPNIVVMVLKGCKSEKSEECEPRKCFYVPKQKWDQDLKKSS